MMNLSRGSLSRFSSTSFSFSSSPFFVCSNHLSAVEIGDWISPEDSFDNSFPLRPAIGETRSDVVTATPTARLTIAGFPITEIRTKAKMKIAKNKKQFNSARGAGPSEFHTQSPSLKRNGRRGETRLGSSFSGRVRPNLVCPSPTDPNPIETQ